MKTNQQQTKPLARKEGLVVQELPDEVLIYDLETNRAHCLNETAALVWQTCDGRKTISQIARALSVKVNANLDEKIVWFALNQLSRNDLLVDAPRPPSKLYGMNRRELVRALGVIVAIPVVASIVAPTPAEAATGCATAGQPCGGANPMCCSGCSCDGTCFGS
ncbi:MAG TPA: PqqD family protein, partial [Pyrinomonadaceae bacterium]